MTLPIPPILNFAGLVIDSPAVLRNPVAPCRIPPDVSLPCLLEGQLFSWIEVINGWCRCTLDFRPSRSDNFLSRTTERDVFSKGVPAEYWEFTYYIFTKGFFQCGRRGKAEKTEEFFRNFRTSAFSALKETTKNDVCNKLKL